MPYGVPNGLYSIDRDVSFVFKCLDDVSVNINILQGGVSVGDRVYPDKRSNGIDGRCDVRKVARGQRESFFAV